MREIPEYLKCPVCGNVDPDFDWADRPVYDYDGCDGGVVEHCSCLECGATWDVVHKFYKITNIGEKEHVQ